MNDRIHSLAAEVFKALGHPLRVTILDFLGDSERCVCEIVEALDLPQPTVSKHLAMLNAQGLISRRRDGARVLYRRSPEAAALLAGGRRFVTDRLEAEIAFLADSGRLPGAGPARAGN